MNILILTSSANGTASHHLDYLMRSSQIKVCMVILNEGKVKNKKRLLGKKIGKLFKIGLFGALNGLRMRNWYGKDLTRYITIDNIQNKCSDLNIPFYRTTSINIEMTADLFRKSGANLGISLGNGYISNRIYAIPKYGMINIHHEILPQYQNAQSIIWQLYNGSSKTGYTIHKIDRNIDTGEIILQEEIPIEIGRTLPESITRTYIHLLEKSAIGLVRILENFDFFLTQSKPQGKGNTYTTPSFRQFLHIERQFRKMKRNLKEKI